MEFECLFKEKISNLYIMNINSELDLFPVIKVYVDVDVILFQWYCYQNWKEYRYGIKDVEQRKLLRNCSNELFYFYEKFLKTKYRYLPKGFEECCIDNDWQFCSGDNSYTRPKLSSVNFVKSIKKYQRKKEQKDAIKRSFVDIENISNGFYNMMKSQGWNLEENWLRCDIHVKSGITPSLTCLTGYREPPNVLWYNNGRKVDCLTLWHELGHVMHYSLAMKNQNFYQFESSIFVKEIIAFFWEALSLIYVIKCVDSCEKKTFLSAYKKQSDWYASSAESLKQENIAGYKCYYPIARNTGEHLALAVLENRVSKQTIIEFMSMGAKLTASTLMRTAGIKDDNYKPITPY